MASTFEALLLAQVNLLLNPPRFRGSILSATALTTGSNINYTTVSEDTYGGWNATNHYWVAPVAGLYAATIQKKWGSTTPASAPALKILGGASNTTGELFSPNAASTAAFNGVQLDGWVRANVGDQLSVQVTGAGFTTQVDAGDNNFFEIYLISL